MKNLANSNQERLFIKQIKAGTLAGCKTIFIDRNYSENKPTDQDFTVKSFIQAVKIIKKNHNI